LENDLKFFGKWILRKYQGRSRRTAQNDRKWLNVLSGIKFGIQKSAVAARKVYS